MRDRRRQASRPQPFQHGQWPIYTGDNRGTRYSPLDQIDASNFNDLEVAWRFKTDNLGTRPEYKLEGTPLVVGGVLYTTAGTRRAVIALDAATGERIEEHRDKDGARGAAAPRQLSGRGLSLDRRPGRRRIYVTPGYRLIALDAKTRADPFVRRGRHRGSQGRASCGAGQRSTS
jgi:quinoprotein glucose dehydrogenase